MKKISILVLIVLIGTLGQTFAQSSSTTEEIKTGRIELKMPLTGGVSGTTTDLLKAELDNMNIGLGIIHNPNYSIYLIRTLEDNKTYITVPTTTTAEVGQTVEVKKRIGGSVNADWITNTCAIRMSRTLN